MSTNRKATTSKSKSGVKKNTTQTSNTNDIKDEKSKSSKSLKKLPSEIFKNKPTI